MATLAQRITDLAAAVRDKFNAIAPKLVPAGGTAGQVLAKTSGADHVVGWVAPGGGGGSSNIDGGNAASIATTNIDGGTAAS